MIVLLYLLKYAFALALAVEVGLILRALFQLARDKARAAQPAPAEE